MRINVPLEMIFVLGTLLLTVSLLIYGGIIKKILILIGKKGIWVFPIIGGIVLLIAAILHIYRIFNFGMLLSHADPGDLFPLIIGMLQMKSFEAWTIFLAGVLGLLGSGIYFAWLRR
ncbi:hypothetical protein DRQ23_01415 [bacterium]|nr:MAG: hypothetical protein DRQ23_01415 [bacterium]